MNNIVIFGPIHSGKSTLMGYIKAHSMNQEERLEKERQIKKQLYNKGISYKIEDRFTYFISTDKDEIITDSTKNSIGTTKRIHIKNISYINKNNLEVNLVFIDTPGLNTSVMWKNRYDGIFMGDIGIFVIDINEIINIADMERESEDYNTAINELFAYLFLWKIIKKNDKLMIVLSKIDTIYSVNDIQYAKEFIEDIGCFKDIPIIPIGIDVENDKSYNIFTSQENKETSFIEHLFEVLHKNIYQNTINKNCFAYLESILKVANTDEKALRIKMLDGILKQSDKVIMLPVKYKNENIFEKAVITIKSLKLEDREIVNSISAGDIGGILPTRILIGNKKIELNEINEIKTTCIIGENTSYIIGNLISFKTRLFNKNAFKENFMKLRINQSINIVWFGKVITASFCSKYIYDEYCYFNVLLNDYPIVMPLNAEEKYFIKNFALEINNCYFFRAELEDINNLNSDSEKLYIAFPKNAINITKDEIEEYLKIKLHERSSSYEVWMDVNKEKFKDTEKRFGKFICKYKIQNYIFNIIGSDGEIFDQSKTFGVI